MSSVRYAHQRGDAPNRRYIIRHDVIPERTIVAEDGTRKILPMVFHGNTLNIGSNRFKNKPNLRKMLREQASA